ncbi:hypothetical protein CYMTET_8120 [Cymbomonas tetramitiformis]|uniref:Uncharacterized protein n=1 Tax=Cymbomonas tetramitiformis TaxID=36881 RepID=A0AAE0GTM7_9CHLO|nr:hypothetical protein CYMTET_8120 [Cymbomonas tetramitiformis]
MIDVHSYLVHSIAEIFNFSAVKVEAEVIRAVAEAKAVVMDGVVEVVKEAVKEVEAMAVATEVVAGRVEVMDWAVETGTEEEDCPVEVVVMVMVVAVVEQGTRAEVAGWWSAGGARGGDGEGGGRGSGGGDGGEVDWVDLVVAVKVVVEIKIWVRRE